MRALPFALSALLFVAPSQTATSAIARVVAAQDADSAQKTAEHADSASATNQDNVDQDGGQQSEQASGPDTLREHCKTAPCRRDIRIRLRREKGDVYDETFELLPPAVQPGLLSIHPGETVSAVPIFENGEFTGWRLPGPDEPAGTQILTIKLSQSDDRPNMMARVSTNTGPALKLRMGLIRLDGNEEPESTSSCPLAEGGFSSFEMWPYPIFVLLVADAKRPATSDGMKCE